MGKHLDRWGRQWLLAVLIAVWIAACQAGLPVNHRDQPLPACRLIQQDSATICVPAQPQRIVTLAPSTLATVMALGVKPIGTTSHVTAAFPPYLQDVRDIQLISGPDQPNLEEILLLKPDLILGTVGNRAVYAQLSQIAPTVLFSWQGTGSWQQHLQEVAEVLDRTEQAQRLFQIYYQRLAQFQQVMGDRLQTLQVSYIDVLDSAVLWCDVENSFAGMILKEAGLQRPPTQAIVTEGGYTTFSLETMHPNADGDVLFTSYWSDETGAQALKRLQHHPLWWQLAAVQQNRVYGVDRHIWRGSNILAAFAVIDDLFRYLAEESSGEL